MSSQSEKRVNDARSLIVLAGDVEEPHPGRDPTRRAGLEIRGSRHSFTMRRSRSRCWSKSVAGASGRRRRAARIGSFESPGVLSKKDPNYFIRTPVRNRYVKGSPGRPELSEGPLGMSQTTGTARPGKRVNWTSLVKHRSRTIPSYSLCMFGRHRRGAEFSSSFAPAIALALAANPLCAITCGADARQVAFLGPPLCAGTLRFNPNEPKSMGFSSSRSNAFLPGAFRRFKRQSHLMARRCTMAIMLLKKQVPAKEQRLTLCRRNQMPFVNVKVIEGVFTAEQKQEMIRKLTDTMVSIEGEAMRSVTWVVVEEVKSGDWGIGGNPLTTGDVKALAGGKQKG